MKSHPAVAGGQGTSPAATDPWFVSFGETMVRDTPADLERPERTRLVYLSLAGSEFSTTIALSRWGIPSAYITRVPDNPYGRMLRNTARAHGVDTRFFVWAPKTEPMARFIYELGRTPRPTVGVYQRMYAASSRLGKGMVAWAQALAGARLLHTTGITFGLATHSGYSTNHWLASFNEALAHKPPQCLVGLDFNYRRTLWPLQEARATLTPILEDHVDVLITTVQDMATFYDISCDGRWGDAIRREHIEGLPDEALQAVAQAVIKRFGLRVVAFTMRYVDTMEVQRWESCAATADGTFFRSPAVRDLHVWDRLGGGDAWTAGFYYGLLTVGLTAEGLAKGVMMGDAATRLQQSMMYDLPIIDKSEIEALMQADRDGTLLRPSR